MPGPDIAALRENSSMYVCLTEDAPETVSMASGQTFLDRYGIPLALFTGRADAHCSVSDHSHKGQNYEAKAG